MALDRGELERLVDDQYRQRRISGMLHCGNCGYNLHSLPYVYNCPECGNAYNGRPLHLKGIFQPYEIEFPFWDVIIVVLCGPSAPLTLYGAFSGTPTNSSLASVGVILAATAALSGVRAYGRLVRFLRARRIARVIEAAEEEGYL